MRILLAVVGDDTDIQWRFETLGLKRKSSRNIANIFHLYHHTINRGSHVEELKLMNINKSKKRFICEQGLNTHKKDTI